MDGDGSVGWMQSRGGVRVFLGKKIILVNMFDQLTLPLLGFNNKTDRSWVFFFTCWLELILGQGGVYDGLISLFFFFFSFGSIIPLGPFGCKGFITRTKSVFY